MADTSITYESLQEDNDFLDSAYYALRSLGINTVDPSDPKDILDTFIEKRRYFETNLLSTINQGSIITDLPDDDKKLYRHALDKMQKMPDFWDEGGTGWGSAVGDFIPAGITDPTNWLSAAAAFFTAGIGGVGIQTAKEATKQGIKHALMSRIKATLSPRMLKAYAAESTVAGAGGAGQEVKIQDVDIDLGRRKDIDLASVALRGITEAALTTGFGVTTNLVGGSIMDATKPLRKSIGDLQAVSQVKNFLKNNLTPLSSLDEVSVRLSERTTGESRPVVELVEKLTLRMDDTMKKDFVNPDGKIIPEDIELINMAMGTSGKKKSKISSSEALTRLRKKSPDMVKHIKEFHSYVKEMQELAGSPAHLSANGKNIYKYDPNKPYARDVFEKFVKVKRPDIDKWLELPENQSVKSDLFEFAKTDKSNWGTVSEGGIGLFDKKGKPLFKSIEEKDMIVNDWLRQLYAPVSTRKAKRGPTKAKQEYIAPIIRQIYGTNSNPATRALETVQGIVDSSTRLRLSSSLGDSLLKQGRAVRANSPQDAMIKARQAGISDQDMVPLVTVMKQDIRKPINPDSPFILEADMFNRQTLGKIFVPKDEAYTLRKISEQFDGRKWEIGGESRLGEAGNDLLDLFAGIQGYLKKNKTVYSLQAQARNALGAAQYVIGTGNGRGIADGIAFLARATPERKKELSDVISKLGLKGSQVEIGQILSRIGELDNIKNKGILKQSILNIMTMGTPALEKTGPLKKFAKFAQKVYVATDDMGKIASFLRERKRSQSIWNARSDAEKKLLRQQFSDEYGINPKTKDFESKLLDEEAVRKVMNIVPVYSRIPLILEKARGVPIVGSFTAFPAENLRNKYNLFKLAGNEVQEGVLTGNNPLFVSGLNRLAMQATVASAPSVAAYFYNQSQGTDHVVNALRKSSAPWEKHHALAVRKDKKKDKYYYTDLSYNNPDQHALDYVMPFIVDVANGANLTESLDKHFMEMLSRQAGTFLDPSLAIEQGKTAVDMIKAWNKGDWDSVGDLFAKWWKLSETGIVKMGREMGTDLRVLPPGLERNFNKLFFGEDRKHLEDSGSLADWFAKHGLNTNVGPYLMPWSMASREREFNPKKNFAFTTRTLMQNSKEVRKTGLDNINEQLLDKSLPVDYEYIAKTYDDMLATEFAAYQQMAELLSSYMEFMKPVELNRLLKDKDTIGSISKRGMRFLQANLYDTSPEKRLSSVKNKIYKEIKKGNPNINLFELRKFFQEIEKPYNKRLLSKNTPEPVEIVEE